MTDADYIAEVIALQDSPRPRRKWRWKYLAASPMHTHALLGLGLAEGPSYRSPHSDVGNIAWCKQPIASCVEGGWWIRGQCCREETYPPAGAPCVDGVCARRKIGEAAMSVQVSIEAKAPRVDETPPVQERLVRAWLARTVAEAERSGIPAVVQGSKAHRSLDVTCTPTEARWLAEWCWQQAREQQPWRAPRLSKITPCGTR